MTKLLIIDIIIIIIFKELSWKICFYFRLIVAEALTTLSLYA